MEASTTYSTTVDTDTFHPRDPDPADRAEVLGEGSAKVLPLPAPAGGGGLKLGVGGGAASLDHLGPMVVGVDGSLSRIANWDKLTEREREVRRAGWWDAGGRAARLAGMAGVRLSVRSERW